MIQSFEGTGGVAGTGGVNPYREGSPKSFDEASMKDRRILVCAQCHVEYVCGKSSIDKQDRDAFGWSKANDLHELYTNQFGYQQDFKNKIMGEPLIKSQHPETELYWESTHYVVGATCSDCHMPEVTRNNRTFRSHWFTSPYKYGDAKAYAAFVASMGLDPGVSANPCARCHGNRIGRAIGQQKAFFEAQARVETLLAQSVRNIGDLKAKGRANSGAYKDALEAHQKAHAVWENLAVSENSMGFHNFEEAMSSMAEAEKNVRTALAKEAQAAK
jgi:nitrite reductase (cytochrome c-552)